MVLVFPTNVNEIRSSYISHIVMYKIKTIKYLPKHVNNILIHLSERFVKPILARLVASLPLPSPLQIPQHNLPHSPTQRLNRQPHTPSPALTLFLQPLPTLTRTLLTPLSETPPKATSLLTSRKTTQS